MYAADPGTSGFGAQANLFKRLVLVPKRAPPRPAPKPVASVTPPAPGTPRPPAPWVVKWPVLRPPVNVTPPVPKPSPALDVSTQMPPAPPPAPPPPVQIPGADQPPPPPVVLTPQPGNLGSRLVELVKGPAGIAVALLVGLAVVSRHRGG